MTTPPPYMHMRISTSVALHTVVHISSHCPDSDGAGQSMHREAHHDLGSPPLAYPDMVLRPDLHYARGALGEHLCVMGPMEMCLCAGHFSVSQLGHW